MTPSAIERALARHMMPRDRQRMHRIASLAARQGRRIWLVGGPVRDLLLGRDVTDVDLAIDGAVRRIGRSAAGELRAELRWHPRFLTAVLSFSTGHVDLAATRSETYPAPAGLPRVRPAGIERDLARRDFGINAMAVEIRPRGYGGLLDPFDGRADLKARELRVLHEGSFTDDPTRVFRAARFAARFAFRLERSTLAWMRRSIAHGDPCLLSGERVANELRRVLREPRPAASLALLTRWNLGDSWGAPCAPTRTGLARLRHAGGRLEPLRLATREHTALLLAAAFHDAPRAARVNVAERLRVMRVERRLLLSGPEVAAEILERFRRARGGPAVAAIIRDANPSFLRLAALLAGSAEYAKIRRHLAGAET